MKTLIEEIGACVLSVVLMAIPILWISSFLCEWDGFLKTLLTILVILEYMGLVGTILVYVDEKR